MMKTNKVLVGITINKFKGILPHSFLQPLQKMGIEFIEISESIFENIDNFIENIANIQTGFHLPNSHDDGYDFSSSHHDAHIQKLIELINTYHKQLNVHYCLSHPPECIHEGQTTEDRIVYLLNNLKKLESPIVIENTQGWEPEKFTEFYERARDFLGEQLIGQCFDASHYFLQGFDPVEFLINTNGKIRHMHLSDCKGNKDAHMPFDLDGDLPIEKILNVLKKQRYEGYIDLELLPRKISDLKPVMNSYLKVLKYMNPSKYYRTKIKMLFFKSTLKSVLKKAF